MGCGNGMFRSEIGYDVSEWDIRCDARFEGRWEGEGVEGLSMS